ncbi:MAG: potassium channel family protein, partial [Mycobacteriaceae bacterium]
GLSAFTVLMVWHVRSITRARAPGLRAIESLFTALPLFLLVFATVYFILGQSAVTSFSEPLTRTDALYFTVTVFSTVGFGDITPTTGATRVVVMIQMFGGLLVLGAGLRLLLGAAQLGQKRRSAERQRGGGADLRPRRHRHPRPVMRHRPKGPPLPNCLAENVASVHRVRQPPGGSSEGCRGVIRAVHPTHDVPGRPRPCHPAHSGAQPTGQLRRWIDPLFELHNLTTDPEQRHNRVGDAPTR